MTNVYKDNLIYRGWLYAVIEEQWWKKYEKNENVNALNNIIVTFVVQYQLLV